LRDSELTKLLGWPGYRVYRHEINERAKTLKLWIRRKRGNRKLVCSGCGRKLEDAHDVSEREVRDLPCMEFRTTVVVEVYRVCCPDCGIKIEKVLQLPSKAPFSKRFEDAVGQACESAAARQVALRFGLASSTVRAIDLRYLERWAAARRKPALVQMGVDEIHLGKKQKHCCPRRDRPVAWPAENTGLGGTPVGYLVGGLRFELSRPVQVIPKPK
jgi:transposase